MIDKEIKLAFKRWYEAAREIEPFLNRGISEQDIFYAGYQAGRDAMREECLQECSAEATDNGTAQRIEEAIRNLK